MNRNVEIQSKQIAEMIAHGVPRPQIAREMGLTFEGLKRILRCVEYLDIESKVREEVAAEWANRLKKRTEMELELENLLPEAMAVLAEHVREKRDLRAAMEVLERDPIHQFAKVSRVDIKEAANPIMSGEALASALKQADRSHRIIEASELKQ